MEFFKPNTRIDFMGARLWTAVISLLLMLSSFAMLMYHGLNWGLDFTGGLQIELAYSEASDLENIRDRIQQAGFPHAVVQSYGSSKDVLISLAPDEKLKQSQVVEKIMSVLPGAEKRRVDFVGPQVGAELMQKGFLAIIVALLGTMIYIAFRFETRLAVCSVIALIHDPVLILGIFAYYQFEFDLKVLSAMLAVIGYSLNDTIVVFDRVRENFRRVRGLTPVEIMNQSINQTLSRTIMTSVLTLIVVVALLVYGGESIFGFSLALLIGIIVGTYSSIYVAGTSAIALGLSRQDFIREKVVDERP